MEGKNIWEYNQNNAAETRRKNRQELATAKAVGMIV
jgi:hypothetical protein